MTLAIVNLELLPTEISFLGINLQNTRVSPPLLVSIVVEYLWCSFLVYGFRDWVSWWRSTTGDWAGRSAQIKRHAAANFIAEGELLSALKANAPGEQKLKIKWPDGSHEQEMTIQDLKQGLPFWKERVRAFIKERRISVADRVIRTVWEFVLPFLRGATVTGWLVWLYL